jgi:hypothetical protein
MREIDRVGIALGDCATMRANDFSAFPFKEKPGPEVVLVRLKRPRTVGTGTQPNIHCSSNIVSVLQFLFSIMHKADANRTRGAPGAEAIDWNSANKPSRAARK